MVIPLHRNFGYDSCMNIGVTGPTDSTVELRAAVRFPLCIPITVTAEAGELAAMTVNISANGILFEVPAPLVVGSIVSFVIPMPAEAMGTATDMVAKCSGRVVRCNGAEKCWQAAALIDKYYFSH